MHIQRLEFGGLSVWLRNREGREGVRISRSTEGRRLPQPIIFFVLRKTSRNHDKGRRNLSSFDLIEFLSHQISITTQFRSPEKKHFRDSNGLTRIPTWIPIGSGSENPTRYIPASQWDRAPASHTSSMNSEHPLKLKLSDQNMSEHYSSPFKQ